MFSVVKLVVWTVSPFTESRSIVDDCNGTLPSPFELVKIVIL